MLVDSKSYDSESYVLSTPLPGIVGQSAAMLEVSRLAHKAAESSASVLLLGETGTGKELVATALHKLSHRGNGPMVKVNCGALSESLLESELFGHVRGAFTGAVNNRIGRFEAAHRGTLFLDEIDSTSLKLQVKLLRVLQEREFERVGDTQTIRVDVRVIAASNRDLKLQMEAGQFREDLYWRLNVIPIRIPPLRERREDIEPLIRHFLRYYSEQNGRQVAQIAPDALELLECCDWPGNVRELQNYIERSVVMADGDTLTIDLLPEDLLAPPSRRGSVRPIHDMEELTRQLVSLGIHQSDGRDDLHRRIVNRVERELLSQILNACNQTQTRAAVRLGMNRNTLHKKIKEHGLEAGSA